MSWFGLAGGIVNGLFGNVTANQQIQAQKDENEKTRQYNLMLARQQNQWNIEQWNRENNYNSPTNQMQRFKDAGLNPNLIYGQSNTSGQISGSLTSGAAASPVDMSPMSRKQSIVAQALMNSQEYRMKEKQIEAIDQNTKSVAEDTRAKSFDNDIRDIIKTIPGNPKELDALLSDEDGLGLASNPYVRKSLLELRGIEYASAQLSFNELYYQAKKKFASDIASKEIDQLAVQLDISHSEATFLCQTLFARIAEAKYQANNAELQGKILTSEADIKHFHALLSDPKVLESLPDGMPTIIKILGDVVSSLLPFSRFLK